MRTVPCSLLLLAAACGTDTTQPAPEEQVAAEASGYWQVVDDVFSGEERWEVLSQAKGHAVQRRPMRAAGSSFDRTESLVGWAMPPPASVGLLAPSGEDPLRLVVSVGPDGKPPPIPRVTVRFSMTIEGEEVWSRERTIGSEVARPRHRWEPVLDESGEPFLVEPGDEVRFRTRLVENPDGEPLPEGLEPPLVGFAGPRFERWVEFEGDPRAEGRPYLLLYVVDTLRRDKLSPYRAPDSGVTPALQALADRGVVFEQAYSTAPWTWPSTASILTGLLPAEHGLEGALTAYLDGRLETVAERARSRGYLTAAFVGNPLIDQRSNFQQGFEEFAASDGQFRKSHELVPPALEWLEQHGDDPFLLYVHTVDTHYPYEPYERFELEPAPELDARLPEHLREWHDVLKQRKLERLRAGKDRPIEDIVPPEVFERLEARYLACVRTADHWFGETVGQLERQGRLGDTVIAFTTDHGEEFLEHELVNHGASVNEALVHVPLILAGPGVPQGRRVDRIVSNRYLADTFARLAGGSLEHALDPVDLLTGLDSAPGATFASSEVGTWDGSDANLFGVFDGRFALHTVRDVRFQDRFARLYDLRSEGGEFEDVAQERPQEVERLLGELREHLREAAELPWGLSRDRADETVEFLEQLGYTAPKHATSDRATPAGSDAGASSGSGEDS